LQFGAPLQRLQEERQRRFDGFAALRQTVQEARAIEVAETGNPGRVRMRFKIAPGGKLAERDVDVLNSRWCIQPSGFAQYFVRSQLQTVLPFGCRKDVHDAAVKFRFLGTHMPEQLG